MSGFNEVEYYVDAAGKHRWRVRDKNNRTRDPEGEITGASSEGFASKQKAQENYAIGRYGVAGGREAQP